MVPLGKENARKNLVDQGRSGPTLADHTALQTAVPVRGIFYKGSTPPLTTDSVGATSWSSACMRPVHLPLHFMLAIHCCPELRL